MITDQQANELQSLMFMTQVDKQLKVLSSIDVTEIGPEQRVILKLDIFYDNDAITSMTFDLHNYTFDEIIDTARNIKSNEFILNEIDVTLASWGD